MAWRVPVLGQHDMPEPPRRGVDDRHNFVAARHRKPTSGAEIVLKKGLEGALWETLIRRGRP